MCEQTLAAQPDMRRAITCTTRAPRPGEQNGVDYHFLDPTTFQRKVDAGEFLEHATVYDKRYGTLKSEVLGKLQAGHDVLLNIDVQGAASIRACAAGETEIRRALVTVFLTPPSVAVLEQRLRKRGKDSEEVIQQRLAAARREIAEWTHFDYLIVSGPIADDLRQMLAILEAERLRQGRARLPDYEQ